jgi:hypothetical protein
MSIKNFTDQQIAEIYSPLLFFHPDEKHFPVSIEQYIDNSDLYYKNNDLIGIKNTYNIENLPDLIEPYTDQGINNLSFYPDLKSIPDNSKNLENVPYYTVITRKENYYLIQYHFIYAYNGAYNILGCIKTGEHNGDLEHLSIQVEPNNGNILKAYFARHRSSEGRWYESKDCIIKDNHIQVYVALNGHGIYNKPGIHCRFFSFANDYTSSEGLLWWSKNIIIVDDNTKWIFLKINLGYLDFGNMIGNTGYYRNEYSEDEPYSIYCFPCILYSKKTGYFCS